MRNAAKLCFIIALFGFGFGGGYLVGHNPDKCCDRLREYQMSVDMDSIYIYDNDRLVGQTEWTDGEIDNIILRDNK